MSEHKIDAVLLFRAALPEEKRKEAYRAYKDSPVHERNKKLSAILEPVMPEIDKYTGQKNELRYFAYLLEHVFNEIGSF